MLAAFGLRTFREQFVKITVNNFLLRIYLIVFTEYGVERLNLRQRNLIELDYPIALTRRVENVIIYILAHRAYTVDTTYALHEFGGVPGYVIVNYDIAPVKIDAFGKHIGGDYNFILVLLLLLCVIGIKVLLYILEGFVAVVGGYHHHIFPVNTARKIFHRID